MQTMKPDAGQRQVPISVCLPLAVWQRIQEQAHREQRRSASSIIREAVLARFDEGEADASPGQ